MWTGSAAGAAWERQFHDTVTELIADGGLTMDLSSKGPLLEKLADNLEHEQDTTDSTVVGSMLALWILVVGNVDQVSVVSYKYTCFRLMTALLRRPEFKLQGLDFDFNTQDVRKEGDPEAWRRIHLVRKLISDTFLYSSMLLLHDNQSAETHKFCAVVVAHAYFVFPMIQAPFVDVCTWRHCHHQAISTSSLHTQLSSAVRALSSQPTHTEFMDRTPDLFHWGWLAKPTDAAILPDDSTWRLLLDANDGHLFCAFVAAFHDHVARTIDASASHVSVVQWGMVPGYMQLIQLFGDVLYDALVTLTALHHHQDHRHPANDASAVAAPSPTTTLFAMTPDLCRKVLVTATSLATCGHVVHLWLAAAVAASNDASPSKTTWATTPPVVLDTTTAWIQVAASPHSPRKDQSSVDSTAGTFQNLLLYPSYIHLQDMVAHVAAFFSKATADDEHVAVAVLVWVSAHLQRLRVEDKAVLVHAIVDPHAFYTLFLHWSPAVRLCFRHLLVYRVFRHDRRALHLASDSAMLALNQDASSTSFPVEDKPADLVLSDSPSLILDLTVASKLDTFVYVLQHPPPTAAASRMFPESLDIFVDGAVADYAATLQEYYDRCHVVETSGGDPIKATDVIDGPALQTLLSLERKRHFK